MNTDFWFVAAPAILSLAVKMGIYYYARRSKTHTRVTQCFLLFLFCLSLQNVAEILHLYSIAQNQSPYFGFIAFYVTSIAALALLVELSLLLSYDTINPVRQRIIYAVKAYAIMLIGLLIFTRLLVKGMEPIGYSVTRIPGELYFLFELYAVCIAASVLILLIYGAFYIDSKTRRTRNVIVLVGLIPLLLSTFIIPILLHFGFKQINASVVLPFTITFFLLVACYAIYQTHVFDIRLFIPFTKARKRKTLFHDGVRSLISSFSEFNSIGNVIQYLSSYVKYPIAMVGSHNQVMATSLGADSMLEIPTTILKTVREITVAEEIKESDPVLYDSFQKYDVGAVIPYGATGQLNKGWLLFGDGRFDKQHHHLDFAEIEDAFKNLGDVFLDSSKTLEAQSEYIASSEKERLELEQRVEALERENQALKQRKQDSD